MSDSEASAFSFLSNWKFGLAVCVPCFAVGLGVTYYYYSKTPSNKQPIDSKVSKRSVVNIENEVVTKSSESNCVDQNTTIKRVNC